ncbi:hypothetical protein BTUL_0051g00600 [Botrytis tulipae]|uniref:Uncharacterized protein n=1 Tax=Botrytis tulipae TaxID=87230 RepID=A0A4Z1EQC4_9HELO|nr:hypothetical protein BTUL_0051g00600 [Botrytis tulipae]
MFKRPAAADMSSFMGPAKKQRSTKPPVKDYISLSKDDLISKKNHLEVVQLLMDLRGAYQQLQVKYREIEEELYDVEHENREYAEVIAELEREVRDYRSSRYSRVANRSATITRLIGDEDELKARIADNEDRIDILLKNNKEYKEQNNKLKTLNKDNATKIARLEAQIAKVAAEPGRNTAVAKQNSFDVRQQAEQLQEVMRSAIRAQIKWALCCKTSGKRWSYTCVVPSADVFYTLFNMDAATELAARNSGSRRKLIRYNSLELVGKDVFLKWDAGANNFTVSGKYGVTAIAYLE